MSGSGTFIQRLINVTFVRASGSFTGGQGNTVKLTGLRVSAKITKAGGNSLSMVSAQIYGMTLDMMNQLSTLGMLIREVPRDSITIEAGDATNGMSIVFQGTITNAWGEFSGMPNVAFNVEAQTGLDGAVKPAEPTSYQGSVDAVTVMSAMASQLGLNFENSDVNALLSNPYFSGSTLEQARACAKAAGISMIVDNGTLAIWQKNGTRSGIAPLISPATGLIGYPSYTAQGLLLRFLYNPSVGYGQPINVESSLARATGTWVVYMLEYNLETLTPNGAWECVAQVYNPKFPAPPL